SLKASQAIIAAAAVQPVFSSGQITPSGKVTPIQKDPSENLLSCNQLNIVLARGISPIAARVKINSAVSAIVTHGRSLTQRTPHSGTTNFSHKWAIRRLASSPVIAPHKTG